MSERAATLVKFLYGVVKRLGVADHSYVVGGAIRNHLLGVPVEDLDLVVDSIELGADLDSAWLARQLQQAIPARTNLVTNKYGVAILTVSGSWLLHGHELQGEKLEIANARRESYGGESGQGYKPHLVEPATILEDLNRRDFRVNTLLWRFADLENGPMGAPVLDLLGNGLPDLEARVLRTPQDPDRTFSDDPTRMLRAIKFSVKYGFELADEMFESIRSNAAKLTQMPWDAVRKILVEDLLEGPDPKLCLQRLYELNLNDVIIGMMKSTEGFQRGVSRSFADKDIRLALLALESGWPLSPSPVAFFSSQQTLLLRMTLEYPNVRDPQRTWDPEHLWETIKQPPIDQQRLFELHGLQGADRKRVIKKARELLLLHPELSGDPAKLEAEVSAALSAA